MLEKELKELEAGLVVRASTLPKTSDISLLVPLGSGAPEVQ